MKIERHSVQWRLMMWGQWTQEPRREFARSSSPFGRIVEMQDNAGIVPDGIRYEIITVDGEAVSVPPDGGLSEACERAGRSLAHDMRCREVESAVADLPDGMRKAIITVYVVPRREKPRSEREAALRLGVSQQTINEALTKAHARVSRQIYGMFDLAAPDEADVDDAA